MADTVIVSRESRSSNIVDILEYYSNAAITTGTAKKEWVPGFYGRILDVIIDSETANSGEATDIADININGTTIYTTQGNRPTLPTLDTGMWGEAAEPEVVTFEPDDIISLDIDQIATTGSARVKVAILLGRR